MNLSLVTPHSWKVVSNTAQESSAVTSDALQELVKSISKVIIKHDNIMRDAANTQFLLTRFQKTELLPTYLFSFAAGDFMELVYPADKLQGEVLDNDLRILAPRSLQQYVEAQSEDIFRVLRVGLRHFNAYFSQNFTPRKLVLVFNPEFATGAI